MKPELTEEEMRRALFGGTEEVAAPVVAPAEEAPVAQVVVAPPVKTVAKKPIAKAFTPRLRVTMRVGNEFEGQTYELIHEADTLSTLLAEQEATKLAKKKYKYVEVVSVKSM